MLEWNWLYGYFVTDEQLSILKEYAGKKMKLLDSDITQIPETYTLYNREYPWSSGSKSVLGWQWENIELNTGETESVTSTVEVPDFSFIDEFLKEYSGKTDSEEEEGESTVDSERRFKISTVTKQYTREEAITRDLGRALNAAQILIWEEEYDNSKEETISYFHPCAELISTLNLRQKKYDGYYYDETGVLVAFDTKLTKQKAGLIIRKEALDRFLDIKKFHLVWFVNAAKEIHDKTFATRKFKDWTGLLEYTGDSVDGEYYTIET